MQLYQRIVWLESQTHVLLSWKREVERDQSSEKAGSFSRQVGKTIPTNEAHTQYESQDSASMADSAKRAPASHVSNVLNVEKTGPDAMLEPPIHSERMKLIDACIGQSEIGLKGGRSFSQSPIEEHLDSPVQAKIRRLSQREFTPRHSIFRKSSLDSLHEDSPFLQSKNLKGSKRTIPDFHDSDLNAFKKRSALVPPPPPPPPQPPQLVQPPLVNIPREMSPELLASRRTTPPEAPPPPPFSKDSHNQNRNKKNDNCYSRRSNIKGHILAQCVNRHPSWENVCLYWNTEKSCKKYGDCVRKHCCVNCLSPEHNFDACPRPIPYQSKQSENRVERHPTDFEMNQRSNAHEMFNHSSPKRFQGDRETNGGAAIDVPGKESKSREQLIEKLADAVFRTGNGDREAATALNIVGRHYQDVKTTHASRASAGILSILYILEFRVLLNTALPRRPHLP
ncbi:hypothetical protein HDU78_007134 [Chytriomyces hyalinus]|nr:hypothetical protein HDU78_007134 [Chytriomyces hyalinus]